MIVSNQKVVEGYFAAVRAKDVGAMSNLRHEEFIQEWPQMKERTRGKVNARLINENAPSLPTPEIKRITGTNECLTAETKLTYGDGSVWDAVNIFEFRDGKILR